MQGKIISTKNDIAEIEILCDEIKPVCKTGCKVCKFFEHGKSQKTNRINAENKINATIGQTVQFEPKPNLKLKGSILLFCIPLVVFLTAIGILDYFGFSVFIGFILAVFFMAVSLFVIKHILKNKIFYKITKVLKE